MDEALVQLVWQRANATCEYCQLPQTLSLVSFEIDHVIATKHGGKTTASNLALTCFYEKEQ
jgi:5-methylcytosine-specific restriction endonuclease McrA